MKRSFFPKVILILVLFFAVAFGILCTYTPRLTTKYLENKQAQSLYRESAYIASDYSVSYFNSDISLADFQKQIEIVGRYLECDVWIMDTDGTILLKSSDASVGQKASQQHFEKIKNFSITDFGNSYYHIGNFYSTFNEDTLSVFSPITISYRIKGYVVIHKPVSSLIATSNEIMWISYYTVGILALITTVLILIWAYLYHRTMKHITDAAKLYSKGDFSKMIETRREDELGYIANTMNYMATELATLEEDERKFISNVSHDFRSPLTSIKGYAQAMIDGTIPVEMQEKYLNIIVFESERLTKLTQDLLDLNQMGHQGMHLQRVDFDINQMIRTTILTFEGVCSKKGLSFDLYLTGEQLFVTADMSKIQQVLYNLIDNATKFSNANTAIEIDTNIKNEKVFIAVKDHGIGIPGDSIKKIWERFYKTDLSRGKDKKGTGLGLAIVKEIIQAHNENINVISTEGVGTEFIFTLPISKKEER